MNHINQLTMQTKYGMIFTVGKSSNDMLAKTFRFQIYKGERPFSCFGVTAPVKGMINCFGLTMIGFEARIMSDEDKRLEKVRGNAASILQRETRKAFRYKRIKLYVNKIIFIKRTRASRKIQKQWRAHVAWVKLKNDSATNI